MRHIPWTALWILALGALVALTPFHLFPVCPGRVPTVMGGVVPMKCHWMGRAVLGDAALTLTAGLVLFFCRQPAARLAVAVLLAVTGLLIVLTPSMLIGVCAVETMPCRMGTAPALYLLGGLLTLTALCIIMAARRALAGAGRRP